MLVESNCDDALSHHVLDRITRIGASEKHARHWTDAGILVFNSFMWWLRPETTLLSKDWGGSAGQNCYGETEPISEEGYWGSRTDRGMKHMAEAAIRELEGRGVKVKYLNITHLSDYRKEAHPSIYRRHWTPPTKEQLSDPKSYIQIVYIGVFQGFLMFGTNFFMPT
ncbi:hypothetical protein ACH5RR_005026 [Cinchona calisaya]|uniref:Trichome birefringence-like C-terminal domain-containing protein n=1 Tax=Cinchona calisaya TaxID=153742 RepID=A0ABD3AZA2_9GENT